MKKTITIAHSPDADDIFMYMAIKLGWIGNDFDYKNTALDIQTLNDLALKMNLMLQRSRLDFIL